MGQHHTRHDIHTLVLQPTTTLLDRIDDSTLLIASNRTGTQQLYELAHGELQQLTSFAEPVTGRCLPGRRALVISQDVGGNERHQLSLLDLESGALEAITDDPTSVHELADVSRDGHLVAFLTNRRNPLDFDVVTRDLRTGSETTAFEGGGWCRGARFSPDGRYLVVQRLGEQPLDSDLILIDLAHGTVDWITRHDEAAFSSDPCWLADSSAFFFSTNIDRQMQSIARYSVPDRAWGYVLDTAWDASCQISPDGSRLLVVQNHNGASRAQLLALPGLTDATDVPLPGLGVMTATPPLLSRDGSTVTFTWTSPRHVGDVWQWEVGTEQPTQLTRHPASVPPESLTEPEAHEVTASDGETIPTWLYRPPGARMPPVAFWIHGGPESQSCATFNPVVHALVASGFAVVVPNVRGSTGYGRRFAALDDTTKRLDAVDDLAALHRWLPSVGLDQTRAALMGGSYGGYLVLAGLSMQPALWAAGVDIVGMSNLVTFLQNTADYRRRHREQEYGSLTDDRAFLEQASPLTHVDSIRAPLLLFHGANDPRVPLSEAEQIAASLDERDVPCELIVYADEGHGLNKLTNRLDAFPRIVEFLVRTLQPQPVRETPAVTS